MKAKASSVTNVKKCLSYVRIVSMNYTGAIVRNVAFFLLCLIVREAERKILEGL